MSPKFSILIAVDQPDPEQLRSCIQSVVAQSFVDWELILVADGPQGSEVESALSGVDDRRVSVTRRPSSDRKTAASQDALKQATGEFIGLVRSSDILSDRALVRVAAALEADDHIDMLYTDEDKLDAKGVRVEPVLKPGFSPDRLRNQMYVGHFSVYRRSLIDDVGGLKGGFEGAEQHDLALRVSERARKVGHLPEVLYHQRLGSTDSAHQSGQLAVASHLERTNFPATAKQNPDVAEIIDIVPNLVEEPLVSVIVPSGGRRSVTRGRLMLLVENALRTLTEITTYQNYEVIVVLDSSVGHELNIALSEIDDRIRCVHDPRPLSVSGAFNLGAVSSAGEVLLFLSDDTQTIQSDWMERMVMYAQRQEIGAVGAKLLFADERVQHAGIWSRTGQIAHRYQGFGRNHPGYMSSLLTVQNCLAVTGACLAVRRESFDLVGGFTSTLPFNFGDVDFCLKLHSKGLRTVVDCGVELLHLDSASRLPPVQPGELGEMATRWGDLLNNSFWDNPNHTSGLVDEYPATSESLLQNWEAIGESHREVRVWANPVAVTAH